MSQTKTKRARKRQLGKFYTPQQIANRLIEKVELTADSSVLEPSAGDGSFVLPLIDRFMELHTGTRQERLWKCLTRNLFAVEIECSAYAQLLEKIEDAWGVLPPEHNLVSGDFFTSSFEADAAPGRLFGGTKQFDWIVGNPPFGGTINPAIQDELDRQFGVRDGLKIKKETYSFFIVKCVEMLRSGGKLRFICSDTFLTIPTMKGLREFLLNRGCVAVSPVDGSFDETTQPMVVLDFQKSGRTDELECLGRTLRRDMINLTGNRSWQITEGTAPLFRGPRLGEFMVASSGMTIGRNELFVRPIVNSKVEEPFRFEFSQEAITLRGELGRARLGRLSETVQERIRRQEQLGETRRVVRAIPLPEPLSVELPHPDYCFYNKSCSEIVYSSPQHAVYWKDEGDAVLTFKKSGNWYLRGVGGQPYFKREGLTWQLIAPSLNARFLPAGYILDSGAPCAFLRDGVPTEELWFVLGWCLSPLCTRLLKDVLNHTRNIQSKDFERLPYPFWVQADRKVEAISRVRDLVQISMKTSRSFDRGDLELRQVAELYEPSSSVFIE